MHEEEKDSSQVSRLSNKVADNISTKKEKSKRGNRLE